MVAPAFGTIGVQLQTTSASPAVAAPASVAAGDIVVVDMFIDGTATVTALPSGFAHVTGSPATVTGTGAHSNVKAWKRASGADAGPYTFTLSGSTYVNAAATRYTGAIATGNPWDATDAVNTTGVNGTASPPVTVTTTGPDRLLCWSATNWSGGNWTPPTGFTERRDSGDKVMSTADLAQASAGSSGAVSGSCAGNDKRTAILAALLPVASGPSQGAAALGLDLAVAATGSRSSGGVAAVGLGMAVAATGARSAGGVAAAGLGMAVAATGSRSAGGAAALGLDLAVAASGARTAEGAAAVSLGLTVSATGQAPATTPAEGSVALSLDLAVSTSGARSAGGSAGLGLDLAVAASGARTAGGSAALGLDLDVSATGSNGQSGRPVKPWLGTVVPVSSYPWTLRPVRSFQEVDQP